MTWPSNDGNPTVSQFSSFLRAFYPGEPAFWWVVGCGLLLLLFLVGRRSWRNRSRPVCKFSVDIVEADAWLPPTKPPEERRESVRRADIPAEVAVADPNKPKTVLEGYVVDRSVTGVRLAVKSVFPIGSSLRIRAVNAPPETPWIIVIVRNCDQVDDCYNLGCQFEEKLPWNVLLLLG